jgi:hypothetical protein
MVGLICFFIEEDLVGGTPFFSKKRVLLQNGPKCQDILLNNFFTADLKLALFPNRSPLPPAAFAFHLAGAHQLDSRMTRIRAMKRREASE